MANVPAGYQASRRRRSTVVSMHRLSVVDPSIQISVPSTQIGGITDSGVSVIEQLAYRRLVKKATRKLSTRPSSALSKFELEMVHSKQPTYRMEPLRPFNGDAVFSTMEKTVLRRMKGFQYSPDISSVITKLLTDEIKDAVKELKFDRYKIVCLVSIGQRQGQGVKICSRCAWDISCDNHCTYTWNNDNVFCTASVFGLYHE